MQAPCTQQAVALAAKLWEIKQNNIKTYKRSERSNGLGNKKKKKKKQDEYQTRVRLWPNKTVAKKGNQTNGEF